MVADRRRKEKWWKCKYNIRRDTTLGMLYPKWVMIISDTKAQELRNQR